MAATSEAATSSRFSVDNVEKLTNIEDIKKAFDNLNKDEVGEIENICSKWCCNREIDLKMHLSDNKEDVM